MANPLDNRLADLERRLQPPVADPRVVAAARERIIARVVGVASVSAPDPNPAALDASVEQLREVLERAVHAVRAAPAELEARLAPLRRPDWLRWASGDEVDALEAIYGAIEAGVRDPTEADRLLCIQIEAAAIRRMLAGETPA